MALLRITGTFLLVACLLLVLQSVNSKQPEVTDDELPGFLSDRDQVRFTYDKVMLPWYNFFKSFAGGIQPRTIKDFVDQFDIKTIDDFDLDLLKRWPEWSPYLAGWVAFALMGLLFLVVVPLVGVLFCCCRTCGNCGGGQKGPKSSGDKCKLFGCGTALFIVTTILTVAAAFVFVSSRGIAYEVHNGVFDTTFDNFRKLENFKNESLNHTDVFIYDNSSKIVDDINSGVAYIPEDMVMRLGNVSRAGPALQSLQSFGEGNVRLSVELAMMEARKSTLTGQRVALDTELTTRRTDIGNLLDQCITNALCSQAKDDLPGLAPYASYSNLSDPSPARMALDAAIGEGINNNISSAVQSFTNITKNVRPETEPITTEIQEEVTNMYAHVQTEYSNFTDIVRPWSFSHVINRMERVRPSMRLAGNITRAAFWGMGMFMIVICLLWLLGLLFGACCRHRDQDEGRCGCNKGQAANLLMAGTGFTVLWYFIFAMFAVMFFLTTGVWYANVCRHVMPWDESIQELERLGTRDNPYYNTTNINFTKAISQCKQDQALYTALDFDANGFNITKLLDLSEYGVDDVIGRLRNISVNIGTVEITTPALNNSLRTLAVEFGTIDLAGYNAELGKGITYLDLKDYAHRLRDIAASVEGSLQEDLLQAATDLDAAHAAHITPMTTEREVLSQAVDYTEDILEKSRLDAVPDELLQAQELLNTQGNALMRDAAEGTSQHSLQQVQGQLNTIDGAVRHDLMHCGDLYEAAEDFMYLGCEYVTNPLQAIGFFFGIFIFFSILGMIFATHVAGYLRRYTPSIESRGGIENGVYYMMPEATVVTFTPLTQTPPGGVGYHSLDTMSPDQLMVKEPYIQAYSPPPEYTAEERSSTDKSVSKVPPQEGSKESNHFKVAQASELPEKKPLNGVDNAAFDTDRVDDTKSNSDNTSNKFKEESSKL